MVRKNTPYCLFKTEKVRVVWEVTHRCNYKCVHCCSKAGECEEEELTKERTYEVLRELKDIGVEEIYYSGGEPFIREDMIDILEKTRKINILANVSTNGSFMTPELAQKLKSIDVNLIHISLDSHIAESYNTFRGGDYYDQTIRAIRNSKEAGLYVRVGAVIWKDNVDMIKDMINFFIRLNVDEVVFNWLITVGRFKDNTDLGVSLSKFGETISKVRGYREFYKDTIKISMHRSEYYKDDRTECSAGKNILFILPDGRISPCSWIAKLDSNLITEGSLMDCTLKELRQSKAFRDWQDISDKRREICSAGCPAICLERNGSFFTEDPLLVTADICGPSVYESSPVKGGKGADSV